MKKGGSISNILKNPIGWINEVNEPIPTKLNNVSTDTLRKYGHMIVRTPIQIVRTPLNKIWTTALNALSLGKFEELQKKYGFDKLFHVGLLVAVENNILIIEKNEVVNISDKWDKAVNDKTEYFPIHVDKQFTLLEMIDRTLQQMGPELFYSYDALRGNNCQNFIENILTANGLLSNDAYNFLFQNIGSITKDLENSDYSYVPDAVKFVTDMGSKVSRIIGKGRRKKSNNKKLELFIDFVKNDGYRFL